MDATKPLLPVASELLALLRVGLVGATSSRRHLRAERPERRHCPVRQIDPLLRYDLRVVPAVEDSQRPVRFIEFAAVFIALPCLFVSRKLPVPLMPGLWGLTGICLIALLLNPDFDRRRLWNTDRLASRALKALLPVIIAAPLLLAATIWLAPDRLFGFVRSRPLLWLAVILLYPVLSAYPQGIVYRAFVFHRYRDVFRSPAGRILASAVAFGVAHVVLHNWSAPTFAFAGGLLFAWTYESTQSSLVASLQHAAFGCLLFTLGLGWYFYYGSVG